MKRIGVLEILTHPAGTLCERLMDWAQIRQYASIMPQSIACWCRQAGHRVFYATYYGLGDLMRLPDDLDVLFVSCTTQYSALAYAAARWYGRLGARTVIGGPHAKCYPRDCERFFHVVVSGHCDKALLLEIVDEPEGGELRSAIAPAEFPSIQDRKPYIRSTSFRAGPVVPMLTSLGCPNGCSFCTDWNNAYRSLPWSCVREDLTFIARNLPGWIVAVHDANLGLNLDRLLDAMEDLGWRNPWVCEADLGSLTESRIRRLARTNCVFVGGGIESWSGAYAAKNGTKGMTPSQRFDAMVEKLELLSACVPYVQAGLIWPSDADAGAVPTELTWRLVRRLPRVWLTISLPVAFGATPMFWEYRHQGRVLPLPFGFYSKAYLTTVPRNYSPEESLAVFCEVQGTLSSWRQFRKRTAGQPWQAKAVEWFRACEAANDVRRAREVLGMMRSNEAFHAFHDGAGKAVPEWYWQEHRRFVGQYADLLHRRDLTPVLE